MQHFRARPSWLIVTNLVIAAMAFGCSKRIPDDVAPAVEANVPLAIKVAEDAAKICSKLKLGAPFQADPMAAPPPPPSPAMGTALATDKHVVDVLITCSWPDPRSKSGDTFAGTSFPTLKGKLSVPVRAVTMPEDLAKNTCKTDPENCERVVVPSRYSVAENTADIRVKRKTPDGTVEVTVAIAP